jgi:ADP-ribosyl-[dinitrogen reductase] hydrolase
MTHTKLNHRRRIENALWGLFIGDALAMPAHWFYNTANISKYLGGEVQDYLDPPDKHVESSLTGARYRPDVEEANRHGRKFDILHDHLPFYDTTYNDFAAGDFKIDENGVVKISHRYHYHYGLKAGDNTLNARLVRLFMRSVINAGGYDPQRFLDDFVEFMTTPGNNPDPYIEGYLRSWFTNWSKGYPAHLCAESQRNYMGINALGGLIRPLVVSLLYPDPYNALGFAAGHQFLTHHSEHLAASLGVLAPMLHRLAKGEDAMGVVEEAAAGMHLPAWNARELFSKYQEHGGMGKVPADMMYKIHSSFSSTSWDIRKFTEEHDEQAVLSKIFSTACFVEHGVPMLIYLAWKHNFDFRKALLANVNAGGDNVHRGMILGMLLGAAGSEIPDNLIEGLTARSELDQEITEFARIITG